MNIERYPVNSGSSVNVQSLSNDAYLPNCWSDDERMSCLMAMFKNRSVNPADYDSRMKFWIDLILDSSRALKTPMFRLSDLTQRFKRKDRIPACLNVVLNEMLQRREILSTLDYDALAQTWTSWTIDLVVKKPLSWLFGYSHPEIAGREFIMPKVLEDLCHKVMEIWREISEKKESDSPSCIDFRHSRQIVEFRNFVRLLKPYGFSERSLALIVEQLRRLGLISIAYSDKNEKLIKFLGESSDEEKTPITDVEKNFFKLQKTVEILEGDLLRLEQSATKFDADARHHIRSNNRAKAKQCLRQKMSLMKQISQKEAACNNGITLLNQLAQTKEQKLILDAFKAGVSAFKSDMAKHGLTADKIDETLDDVHDAIFEHEEISEAISRPSAPVYSDDELEQELSDLLKDTNLDSPAFKLPKVPDSSFLSTSTPISKSMIKTSKENSSDKWKRLLETENS